ncbi:MAG: D-lactate dehydrogenase [Halieaceae bacterium]|jgi:D-lactate dehydrogenase
MDTRWIEELAALVPKTRVIREPHHIKRFTTGIRFGTGSALAVFEPSSLLDFWHVLKASIAADCIVICQAANTGVTGGSTPDGDNYDREIVIISTLKLDTCIPLCDAQQALVFAGGTLYRLEEMLAPFGKNPHSVIGSSCIGASVVGGICNNSGGSLVKRGPAYTELALFARLSEHGELELVNHLGIDLGESPEEILGNLDSGHFDLESVSIDAGLASDPEYHQRVRDIEASTPARFNSDQRRLHEASGSAGKLAVFAVRVDTFDKPKAEQVFYLGTNDPEDLNEIRRRLLSECTELPEMTEYMHQSWFDGADRYCKDTFLFIKYLGTSFLPRLYRIKATLDRWLAKVPWLPNRPADHLLQRLAQLWPDHLPKRMRAYRAAYEHHLIVIGADAAIAEIRQVLHDVTRQGKSAAFFECSPKEGDAALLHRLVAGGSPARYNLIHDKDTNGMVTFDVALPRNYAKWYEFLPEDLLEQCAAPYRGGHFMCHVFHWDFVVKAGVDPEAVKARMMGLLDEIGAKYPAEHNVGHLYHAEPDHAAFYQSLDPNNAFNAGVGKMSKNRCYH